MITGKSLSELLLFEEHGENMLCSEIVLNVKNDFCTQQVLAQDMGRTSFAQKLFLTFRTISVHNMFFPGLSLELSCIELVIQ